MGALNAAGDPTARRAAISVLKDMTTRDPDWAKKLRPKLDQFSSNKTAADAVEKFLFGYTGREVGDEKTQRELVKLLSHEDVGVRELAIETLMAVSRRGDSLGYNPDKPAEGNGLKEWQTLLQRKEIRASPAPKAR